MSKHDFTKEEFASRLSRTREAIDQAGLDWLLVIHPVSMRWLIGQDNKSYTAFQCLPVSAKPGKLTVFTREMERNEFEADSMVDEVRSYNGREPEDPMPAFAKLADELGLRTARIGMEVPSYYLHPHHYLKLRDLLGPALVAEPNHLINGLKVAKSPQELDYHRRSARIAADAWAALLSVAREGATELELSAAVYQKILSSGSSLPASTMNLMTGERSAFALGGPTERRMQRGDTGVVELGGAYRRYTSTLGRLWSIGKPGARLLELHRIVCDASDAAVAEMKAGAPAIKAHDALKGVIARAGLDHYRQHTSGYGMAPGFPPSWGEPTNMFGGSTDVLQANMVMTVEPGLFSKDEGVGVRLIDNFIITGTGVERLSATPRDIAVVE